MRRSTVDSASSPHRSRSLGLAPSQAQAQETVAQRPLGVFEAGQRDDKEAIRSCVAVRSAVVRRVEDFMQFAAADVDCGEIGSGCCLGVQHAQVGKDDSGNAVGMADDVMGGVRTAKGVTQQVKWLGPVEVARTGSSAGRASADRPFVWAQWAPHWLLAVTDHCGAAPTARRKSRRQASAATRSRSGRRGRRPFCLHHADGSGKRRFVI